MEKTQGGKDDHEDPELVLQAQMRKFANGLGAEFTAVYASECGSRVVAGEDAVAVGEPAKSNETEQRSSWRRSEQ